jgi:2-keto-4-pentenoate hydratase/2-oxohepta-3-ene-1,7-dioic acid hydratase in catechol pathway
MVDGALCVSTINPVFHTKLMQLLRFAYQGRQLWGKIAGNTIRVLRGAPYAGVTLTRERLLLDKVRFLAPATPTKIILVGLNYRDHARELKMKIPRQPVIFIKPVSTLVGHESDVVYPPGVRRLDYEAELAVVIKKEAKDIPEKKFREYILGYTCLNDITARDLQRRDGQWTRAKSFDTFCPVGPWVETELDAGQLTVSSYVNGKIKQNSSTANFIFPLSYVLAFISRVMTLLPGDVISTGTPPGVGPLKVGDTVAVEIEGIGRLSNRVVRGIRG